MESHETCETSFALVESHESLLTWTQFWPGETSFALVGSHESLGTWEQFWSGGMISHSWSPTRSLDKMQRVQWWIQFCGERFRTRGVPRECRSSISTETDGERSVWETLWRFCTHGAPRVPVFVSPCVASLSHCESFHCSCICMAQDPCLFTFVFFAPRFIHMSSMSA